MLPRVLVLIEGRHDGPVSAEYARLSSYMMASGQVKEVTNCYYDLDQAAYDTCRGYLPDLVICKKSSPILVRVTQELRIPVLVLDGDAEYPLYCSTGRPDDYRKRKGQRPNLLLLYEAVDPDRFGCQDLPRNIRVCSPAHEYVDYLRKEGVDVFLIGDEQKAHWKINDLLNRSRICLSFSPWGLDPDRRDFGHDEFKVTACGAMLMSTYVSGFFGPNVEMVKFDSPEDLLRLLRFYFTNPRERARIAKAGHYKSADIWTVWHTWAHLFERLGQPVPDFILKTKAWKSHRRLIEAVER